MVNAVRRALRFLDSDQRQQTVGSDAEVSAIRSELLTWKHGAPQTAGPSFAPNLAAHKIVGPWPDDDPLRQLIDEIYEAARTPLP